MRDGLPDEWKVKYRHERNRRQGVIVVRGGKTICTIIDGRGVERALGVAQCRSDEDFNKKMGREIAFGRALKDLESRE